MDARTRKELNTMKLSLYQPRYFRVTTNDYCTMYRCRLYSNENGSCPFVCRIIEGADGQCVLQESTRGHNAHDTFTGVCLQPARSHTA